jgi:hypothetical protein
MKDLLTISGCLSRGQYAIALFLKLFLPLFVLWIGLSIGIFIYFMPAIQRDQSSAGTAWFYILLILLLCVIIAQIFWVILAMKRLRDVDMSPAFSIFSIIPFISVIFTGYLLFAPSKLIDETSLDTVKQDRIPTGMMIILILQWIGIFGMLFTVLSRAIHIQFWPILLHWVLAWIVQWALFLLVIASFVGILRRYKWAYTLNITWLVAWLVLMVVNALGLWANPAILTEIMSQTKTISQNPEMLQKSTFIGMQVTFILSVIYNGVILRYIIKRQEYFSL